MTRSFVSMIKNVGTLKQFGAQIFQKQHKQKIIYRIWF